jgi:23S rRNA (uracil1939-C5)-methyltransferase
LSQILKIEQLVYGGSGLTRTEDGKVVLIPFVLPGERVEVGEVITKGKYFTADPLKVIEANAERINAPCPYYGVCGGCHYQHTAYSHQLDLKKTIVEEQIFRLGGLQQIKVRETVSSEQQFSYRNHVQFHLDPNGRIGFQKSLSHEVIHIEKCLLLEEPLNNLLGSLSFDSEAGLERVALRDDSIGTPLLLLTGKSLNPPEFEVDFPLNVVYRSPAGEMLLSGETFNTFEISGKSFQVSAGSFFQTNRTIAAQMVRHLLNEINFAEKPFILDLFCGVGFFSAYMAGNVARLVGIESSEDACSDFAVNLDPFDNVELYQGTVEQVLPSLEIQPDIAIIDPPRAGMAPAAMKALLKCRPGQIAYISCDPSTFARDLKQMAAAGYQIDSVTPFDMFPQTYHIEAIAILRNT